MTPPPPGLTHQPPSLPTAAAARPASEPAARAPRRGAGRCCWRCRSSSRSACSASRAGIPIADLAQTELARPRRRQRAPAADRPARPDRLVRAPGQPPRSAELLVLVARSTELLGAHLVGPAGRGRLPAPPGDGRVLWIAHRRGGVRLALGRGRDAGRLVRGVRHVDADRGLEPVPAGAVVARVPARRVVGRSADDLRCCRSPCSPARSACRPTFPTWGCRRARRSLSPSRSCRSNLAAARRARRGATTRHAWALLAGGRRRAPVAAAGDRPAHDRSGQPVDRSGTSSRIRRSRRSACASGLELLLVHLNPWRLLDRQPTATTGALLPGVLLLAAWTASIVVAWRLRHRSLLRLHVVMRRRRSCWPRSR